MIFSYVSEARRIFARRLKIIFTGVKEYDGDDVQICRNIIDDCWNEDKEYFMTSSGHFSEFYARDFGWGAKSLVRMGYKEKVVKTLDYALGIYRKHGAIEQTIDPKGRPFTYPEKYSPDALAFLIRSIRRCRPNELIDKYKHLLNWEIEKYYDLVIEKDTGLVRRDRSFNSMKDYSERLSSCHDNVMTGILSEMLSRIKVLHNPFKKYNYPKLIMEHFWTGEYFLDDLSGDTTICGDAQVLPFWSKLIQDRDILRRTVQTVREVELDKPFPLKFTRSKVKNQKMIKEEIFAGDYQRTAIWPHIGMMYIDIVRRLYPDLAVFYLNQYKNLIEEHGNFLEVFTQDGKPFKNMWFYTDESMIWAANYLYLKKKLGFI